MPAYWGLYSTIIGPLIYIIFGTSRHTSIGPAAVTSILIASVIQFWSSFVFFHDIKMVNLKSNYAVHKVQKA